MCARIERFELDEIVRIADRSFESEKEDDTHVQSSTEGMMSAQSTETRKSVCSNQTYSNIVDTVRIDADRKAKENLTKKRNVSAGERQGAKSMQKAGKSRKDSEQNQMDKASQSGGMEMEIDPAMDEATCSGRATPTPSMFDFDYPEVRSLINSVHSRSVIRSLISSVHSRGVHSTVDTQHARQYFAVNPSHT